MTSTTGRPSSFTPEVAEAICERLAAGESLRKICNDDDMPDTATVFRWLHRDPIFREQYARAREAQQEFMAEQILEISDDGANDTYVDEEGKPRTDWDVIARSKLRVDTRKWLMSKLAPKKYGDRIAQEISGPDGAPIQIDEKDAAARVAKLMTLAQQRKDDMEGLIE